MDAGFKGGFLFILSMECLHAIEGTDKKRGAGNLRVVDGLRCQAGGGEGSQAPQ